jgi:hypothetical protein
MKQNKKDLDAMIDNASRSIRDEQIDATMMNESATRVWALVSQQAAEDSAVLTSNMGSLNTMNTNEQIRGCADFQSLIPAYLDGKLSAARTLLLEDHSNECIPCRNELRAQREAVRPTAVAAQPARATFGEKIGAYTRGWKLNNFARLGFAAAAVVVLGLVALFTYERLDLSGTTLAATLENSEGLVFVVSDPLNTRPLSNGEQIQKGEHIRTGKDSNAVLKLADGSTVEMRERSEFYVTQNMRGVTIRLDRGDVIVEAAKQHNGRLYVQTPDSLVSVKGTIFAVESGTKGSRVSVVEGEVKVSHAGSEETLLPGDQTTSSANIDRMPVSQSVAWSRNASKYANLVADLAKLRSEVNQKAARPGVRYSSKFINLLPEDTVFFAALPNLSESLAESQRIMQERIKQNPALAEWKKRDHDGGMFIDEKTMARIREFGSQLGDEIVVSARLDAKGEPSGILVLGDVKNAASFRTYVNEQIARVSKDTGDMPNVQLIDDPMTATTAKAPIAKSKSGEKAAPVRSELFVWINNDVFAASPQLETLRGFAATQKAPETNRFVNTPFYQRISDVYRNGAGLLIAADLEKIVAQNIGKSNTPEGQRHVDGLKQLGITNLRYFVAEQKEVGGRTLSQAALSFSEPNKGIASWLAAPGPMGALDFISPSANVVAAFVVKEPALLADDLLGFLETVDPEMRHQMDEMAKSQGFDIRNDFAAPLGGEFAFAIDGPILPTPSWKIILEVYDQAKLQDTLERSIEKLNQFSMLHGNGKITLESSVSGDRTFYSVKSEKGLEMNYVYTDGYLVAAPTRALLEQSLRNRDAGNTLVTSARFRSSLPQDGNANFSAILYHDLAPLMQTLAEKMKTTGGSEQDKQKLAMFDASAPPTLAYAYAQGDRITFAANTEGGAFGLNPASLIGMPNSFQMQHILMNAMGDKDVQKKSE